MGYRASGAMGKPRLTRVFKVWVRGRPRCTPMCANVHRDRHRERGVDTHTAPADLIHYLARHTVGAR